MRLPINTEDMTFLAVAPPEAVLDYETKTPKADGNGEPLYAVQLVAMHDGAAEIISVKIAGDPAGVAQGVPLQVKGLVAQPWSMGDRAGVSYRAQSIRPAAAKAAEARS